MRRGLLLAGLLFVLTGCGGADQRAAFTESRIPPALGPRFWAPEGWAWGLIGVGDAPVQRYGVSSTTIAPRGAILILADDRELAETWFETVRDLNAAGYTVWVLERAGQGGSARYGGPRDLIHVPSFDDDVAAAKALARNIVSTDSETPLTLVGQGVGGLVALRAIQTGAPAAALVLSSPTLESTASPPNLPAWLVNLGVGRLPTGWKEGWSRAGPDDFATGKTKDRQRGAVQMAWQTANPDLRMGGHSFGWNAAFNAASKATRAQLKDVQTPVQLLYAPGGQGFSKGGSACRGLPHCQSIGMTPSPQKTSYGPGLFLDTGREGWVDLVVCATPDHPKREPLNRRAECSFLPSPGHGL